MKQGAKANKQGSKYENLIEAMMHTIGIEFEAQVNLVGGSIYGGIKRIDFRLDNLSEYPDGLYLELKWQNSGGSVAEKMPYLVDCVKTRFDLPSIIVIGGNGLPKGCEQWVRKQIEGNLIDVMDEQDFIQWMMKAKIFDNKNYMTTQKIEAA